MRQLFREGECQPIILNAQSVLGLKARAANRGRCETYTLRLFRRGLASRPAPLGQRGDGASHGNGNQRYYREHQDLYDHATLPWGLLDTEPQLGFQS